MRKLLHFVREKQTHDLLNETIFIIFAELAHFHKTLEECKSDGIAFFASVGSVLTS